MSPTILPAIQEDCDCAFVRVMQKNQGHFGGPSESAHAMRIGGRPPAFASSQSAACQQPPREIPPRQSAETVCYVIATHVENFEFGLPALLHHHGTVNCH